MELILDGHPILNNVTLSQIGCDTVILFDSNKNKIYICGHFKDYKPTDTKFIEQMTALIKIVSGNKEKTVILMADANTQFTIDVDNNSLLVFSKDLETSPTNSSKFKKFIMEDGITITGLISKVPTSNKMRAAHTAQLDKSLKKVTAVIDHIITFNGPTVKETETYVLNNDPEPTLTKVTDRDTMTTSPVSIADHAFVISTSEDGISYGTLNIKGGDPHDKAWAEFVPQRYLKDFQSKSAQLREDALLLEAFSPTYSLAQIKAPRFTSTPRMLIFDINLPNEVAPTIDISGETVIVASGKSVYNIAKKDDIYSSNTNPVPDWLEVLIGDLNGDKTQRDARRQFFFSKGYMLLNYWHKIQNDTEEIADGKSLSSIYKEWETLASHKVSIANMIVQARKLHPRLQVVSLQELPRNMDLAKPIIAEIERITSGKVYTLPQGVENGSCETRGAIVVFSDPKNGASRKKKSSKRKTKIRKTRKTIR